MAARLGPRSLLLVLVVCAAVAASTALVAASPMITHPHLAGNSLLNSPADGNRSTTYALTFIESGLTAGLYWSVQLPDVPGEGGLAESVPAGSPIVFAVPNGTYAFTVTNVTTEGGEVFTSAPSAGNTTVTGNGTVVNVTFSQAALYPLTFLEEGLPAGASWSVVVVSGYSEWPFNSSTTNTTELAVPNGTYDFTVPDVTSANGTIYAASPGSGEVVVDGANVTVIVSFSPQTFFSVVFDESGLPNGTNWSVALSAGCGLGGGNGSGNGSAFPQCLPPVFWNGSSNASITFTLPNGTYCFLVENVSGVTAIYQPFPAAGNVSGTQSVVTVDIRFTAVVLYDLTFTEAGLPNGTPWFVELFNDSGGWEFNSSTSSSIGFEVANGTYGFTIGSGFLFLPPDTPIPLGNSSSGNGSGPLGPYTPTPGSGNVTINGTNGLVAITFVPLAFYEVTFTETGLPNGTDWSVALSNDGPGLVGQGGGGASIGPTCFGGFYFNSSTNRTIGFEVPNGTYNFSVSNVTNGSSTYVPGPAAGSVVVNGTDVSVVVAFTTVALYNLTFTESGLPNGTAWFVDLTSASMGDLFNGSQGSAISFEVPNGSYNFSVTSAGFFLAPETTTACNNSTAGGQFVPTPASGTVNVSGANATVPISFAAPTLYSVTLDESGLPNGTSWAVALTTGDEPIFGTPTGGAPTSPSWGGPSFWNDSNTSTVGFVVPSGTYTFFVEEASAGNGTEYVATPASGNVTVNGTSVVVNVTFSVEGNTSSVSQARSWDPVLGAIPPAFASPLSIGAVAASVTALLGCFGLVARRRLTTPVPEKGDGTPSPAADRSNK